MRITDEPIIVSGAHHSAVKSVEERRIEIRI